MSDSLAVSEDGGRPGCWGSWSAPAEEDRERGWSVPQRTALIFISYGRQNLDLQGEPAG